MDKRYDFAAERAHELAFSLGQADFCETLSFLLELAESRDEITTGRAVEMMNRFRHYCKALRAISNISADIRRITE